MQGEGHGFESRHLHWACVRKDNEKFEVGNPASKLEVELRTLGSMMRPGDEPGCFVEKNMLTVDPCA